MSEFKIWYRQIAPSLEQIVNQEKESLFNCCDDNKNGVLTRLEIRNNCKFFLKSIITNYGDDVNIDSKSDLNSKDEL